MDRPGVQIVVRNRMQVKRYFTFVLLYWLMALLPFSSSADVLVMHSGERFNASRLWEEDNTIRFDMNGLIVRVDKSEVAQIIRDKTSVPVETDGISQKKQEAEVPHAATAPQRPKKTSDSLSSDSLSNEQAPGQATAPDRSAAADHQHKAAASPDSLPSRPQETGIRGTALPGITWQMQPADLPGSVRTSTEDLYGGIDQYQLPGTDPQFGRAQLDGMLFGFWRNRLYTISCWIAGRPGYERLKAEVFNTYGSGRKNSTGLERFTWQNQTSDRLLEFDDRLNTGIFWMRSHELDRHIRKADLQ